MVPIKIGVNEKGENIMELQRKKKTVLYKKVKVEEKAWEIRRRQEKRKRMKLANFLFLRKSISFKNKKKKKYKRM
jgi:hypothetical protein